MDSFDEEKTNSDIDFELLEEEQPASLIHFPGGEPVLMEVVDGQDEVAVRISGVTKECVASVFGRTQDASFTNVDTFVALFGRTVEVSTRVKGKAETRFLPFCLDANLSDFLRAILQQLVDALGYGGDMKKPHDVIVTVKKDSPGGMRGGSGGSGGRAGSGRGKAGQ